MKPILFATLLFVAATAQAQTPPAQGVAPAPAGDADAGKKLYTSYGCYQCHGFEGQGSSATGPRLGPRPMPLAAFTRYIRRPTGQMPPYGPRIASDADLANIHAYLASRPAPVQNIPLLQK
jgi:mono/diheme cytochrome c family protein